MRREVPHGLTVGSKPLLPSGEKQNTGGAGWSCKKPGYIDGLAKKMRQTGYDRDWKQCRNKIKNLKKEYRQVKDSNTQTGRGRKTCKDYKELDNILGHRPASVPAVLLDTGTTTNSSSAVLENPLSA